MIRKSRPSLFSDIQRLTTMGMLSAIGIVLAVTIHFTLLPGGPIKYDPADVPIFIGALMYGPLAGLFMTIVICAVEMLIASTSGLAGMIMHIAATGIAAIVIGCIYRAPRLNRKWAILSIACGALAMTMLMIPLNLIVTPWFYGVPVSAVVGMLLPLIIPANLIKAGVNGIIAFGLFEVLRIWLDAQGKRTNGSAA
ncbi:MAG: ECF transporter S component [Oscillospiraceae bacterium]|jgi:riboflavin transporter FmnP|nr:ECF transporter S component [Oscillospiraceae bacterium]